ncbi:hypothetical protein [Rummeliibacillus suwonensis]|uniref:hypothetical protein n=1 Tax=Rummeliibacillus suwonensis TaxID=1306154 RepID=UPI00289B2E28|nr:hypothetical protein [Rummeliibacillus suwonensis]
MRKIGGDQLPYAPDWFGGAGCCSLSVATGRGAFHFRSSISVEYEENPTDGSFTLSNSREYLRL